MAVAAMTTPAITPGLILEEPEGGEAEEEPDERGVTSIVFDVVLE